MKIVSPTPKGIAEAVALIRAGQIIAYPTETVYGLAVDPFSPAAIRTLFAAKGRAESNPVLLIAADLGQVERVVEEISPAARRYIDRFWPGPLSLVLPKAKSLPGELCAGGPNVCVRVPSSETARALCAAAGQALTSTSANRSGEPPARSASEIRLDGVALCLDGGTLPPSPPSTVFDPNTRTVLRLGAISEELLRSP